MSILKKIALAVLIAAVLFAGMGAAPAAVKPAKAATCTLFHTVWYGQTLYQIGLMYGVNWVYLAQINNIPNPSRIYAGQVLCVRLDGGGIGGPYTGGPYWWPWLGVVPTFSIANVVAGQSVTITTANFPANDTFDVLMGAYGTMGIGGIKVATVNSGAGGSFQATFTIPPQLANAYQIAIRLQSPTSGYYAYNWFYNNTAGTGTGGPIVPPGPAPVPGPIYYGVPTISISAVKANQTVTVQTYNFPANDTYNVYMGYYGTAGIGGIYVGQINSGAGGSFPATFTIPPQLYGQAQIAIRLQSPTTGYYAYNWFWNSSTY